MTRIVRFAVLAIVVALPLSAQARDVYLNGVKLEPNVMVRNQKFENCEVKFDENGNLYINAKGFKVGLQATGESTAPPKNGTSAPAHTSDGPPQLTKKYWLVAPQPKRGLVQYDIDVYINAQFVKRLKSGDDKMVLEVTKYVKAGDNVVTVKATKSMGDRRVSSSPQDTMDLILGEGVAAGGTITIDRPVVTYKRTAAETSNFTDSYAFGSR